MTTTSKNGAVVPTGGDPYALTADLLKMMESAGLVYPVPTAAVRDAIPSPTLGTLVERLDLGGILERWDGTAWKEVGLTQEYSAVNTADANWTYEGGLYRDKTALGSGKKRVNLTLNIARTALGGNITGVGTTYLQAFTGIIPAGFRPKGYSATCYTILQTSAGADAWGMYVRIDKNGDLAFRADQGSTTVAVGHQIPIVMSWLVA